MPTSQRARSTPIRPSHLIRASDGEADTRCKARPHMGIGRSCCGPRRKSGEKRGSGLFTLLFVLTAAAWPLASQATEAPEPAPIPTAVGGEEQGMSLELYQSLSAKLDALAAPAPESEGDEAQAMEVNAAGMPIELVKLSQALQLEVQANESELLCALRSPQAAQRQLAARVLESALNKSEAVKGLCELLQNDADGGVRSAAAATLGRLGDAAAVEALLSVAGEGDDDLALNAVSALGLLRDDRAVKPLMKTLAQDYRPLLRLQAAASLGMIKDGVDVHALNELMQRESDERVRLMLAAAIRIVSGEELAFEDIPDPNDYGQRLSSVSDEMQRIEQKLRDDHHDEVVQIDQEEVERTLSELIRELEKAGKSMASAGSPKRESSRERKRQLGLQNEPQRGGGSRSELPKPDSRPGVAELVENRFSPSEVTSRKDRWASLPPKERDELLQIYQKDVPVRWRKRIEAYFISVAADELNAEKERRRRAMFGEDRKP